MGATTDQLLSELDASTSRTTQALKNLVTVNGARIENLEAEVARLKTKFPESVFGTIEAVTMGMNGMEEPALQFNIKSMGGMVSSRRKTEFFLSQKLAGPAALQFIKRNKVENTFDLIDRNVSLRYDAEEDRYEVELIEKLPIAFASNGNPIFIGSRVNCNDGTVFTGTIVGSEEFNVYINRDDDTFGGGPDGSYILAFNNVLAVL